MTESDDRQVDLMSAGERVLTDQQLVTVAGQSTVIASLSPCTPGPELFEKAAMWRETLQT
ncbi:hypothetical protein N7535_007475 [Penicillium sp. DV-2018c]|nr:hypothetical protein N7461_003502 [Penicillium sp. DV-2018c]KAJ5565837.1 hypothetical protein N7535_007475 [Penicillium sp. DV-2018c]